MSSAGQIVGGIVGAIIGAYVGGPSGAYQGFVIGSGIGGYVDPPAGPNLKGPTLEDTSFNSAAYGASLATLYGTISSTGSIFYLENNKYKAIAKKKKTGGKGGEPSGSYTTTTYYATFAVAIGEAMPGSVIRRIWAGGKLIYSVGEGVDAGTLIQSKKNAGVHPTFTLIEDEPLPFAEKWHYYDGTQTEPDSRMEAALGVGNCPSYEGTAYIIFYDFDLTEYGNGLQGCPIKVEVVTVPEDVEGQAFQKIFSSVTTYPNTVYDEKRGQVRANLGMVRALTLGGASYTARWDPSDYDNVYAVFHDFSFGREQWATSQSHLFSTRPNDYPGLTFDRSLNWIEYDPTLGDPVGFPNAPTDSAFGYVTIAGQKISFGTHLKCGSLDWDDEWSHAAAFGEGNFFIINSAHIIRLDSVGVVRHQRAVDDWVGGLPLLWYDDKFLYRAEMRGAGDNWVARIWVYDAATLDTLRKFTFGYFPDSAEFLTFNWQFAVYGNIIVVGWTTRHGTSGPDLGEMHYEQWRFKDFVVPGATPLDEVAGRIMDDAGVASSFRDLTELSSDVVDGYRITDASSARGKLGPLQVAYLFDLIDYGYKIKAVKRGGEPIVTIPLSDLGAHAAGESSGVLVRRERDTDSQLPSRYSLTYLDYNREYDTNTQYADFPSSSVNERNQQLPIVLTAVNAAKLADVLGSLAHIERYTYSINLPQTYLGLRLGDVISVETSHGVHSVMRALGMTVTQDQRLEVSAKQAEPAVYQSSALGVAVTPPSENIPLVVAASTVIMNLPAINDSTTSYGFGVAMSGGANWNGGVLLRSIDSGQTFDAIQSFSGNCTLAAADNFLPPGDYFVIDRVSQLTINVRAGEFFSITETQMLSGKNYCAYGVDGRWEIIQYAGATLITSTSVVLDTFVRGLFGTEWAGDLHQAGDTIVFLDDPDNAFIGADAVALGSARKFKGVTTGMDAQLVSEIDFTYRGVNLKPLSVVNVRGYIDTEVWYFNWDYRSRFVGSQWATGTQTPIGEAALLFEIDIFEGSLFKKTYTASTSSFEYSSADQLTDFGYLPTSITVNVYQLSSAIGRGYVADKVLIGIGDIYGASVSLLLHFNGSNNSTVFKDSSLSPATVVANGDAKITTANSIHGPTSGYFDGSLDYLSVADYSRFNMSADDFTIECLICPETLLGSYRRVLSFCRASGGAISANDESFGLEVDSSNRITGFVAIGSSFYAITNSSAMVVNVWFHLALVRISTSLILYINGVSVGSITIPSGALNYSSSFQLLVGSWNIYQSARYFNGWLKDFRVTNSVARYTANFTPPSQQLPDPI